METTGKSQTHCSKFYSFSQNTVERMLKNQMGRAKQQVLRALDPTSRPGSGSSTKPLVLILPQVLDECSEQGTHWGWNSRLTIYPSPGWG